MRIISAIAVIAPKAASKTALTIDTPPMANTTPRGTPTVATIGVAMKQTTTIATDRNASIHMTDRSVRSYRLLRGARVVVIHLANQPRRS
jgi:hypothetical protein